MLNAAGVLEFWSNSFQTPSLHDSIVFRPSNFQNCQYMTVRATVKERSSCRQIVGVIASRAELHRALRMRKPPGLFELRLDYLMGVLDELEHQLSMLQAPLIITTRHPREGGANNLSIQQRRESLFRFLPRASYVDVELRSATTFRSLLELARRKNVRRIISFHDFKSTPAQHSLLVMARRAEACGADIFKVATRIDKPDQLARMLDFVRKANVDLPISAMGIGKLGAASRIALARCGSVLNYASIGRSRIEGQMSIERLRAALRH